MSWDLDIFIQHRILTLSATENSLFLTNLTSACNVIKPTLCVFLFSQESPPQTSERYACTVLLQCSPSNVKNGLWEPKPLQWCLDGWYTIFGRVSNTWDYCQWSNRFCKFPSLGNDLRISVLCVSDWYLTKSQIWLSYNQFKMAIELIEDMADFCLCLGSYSVQRTLSNHLNSVNLKSPLFRSQAYSPFDCHLVLTRLFWNPAISNYFSCPMGLWNSWVWLYFVFGNLVAIVTQIPVKVIFSLYSKEIKLSVTFHVCLMLVTKHTSQIL